MLNMFSPGSFYNTGGHFLFLWVITAHVCLFADISPLQKKSMCALNFLLAGVIAAGIPAALTSSVQFSTPYLELTTGVGLAVALALALSLGIQRVLDIDVEF
ncbi:MAG: hypothetical protein CME59_03005 [Halioglobus sp.]|nr:hypothetical protein [Halioglobus sp.]|tara:strand:- start:1610 stop:1915 length:306 start_codon:yes stop_codon:yes gene_type:complete